MEIQAVLFDLDGVIADTAKYHFLAWQAIASELGISIDEAFNEQLKGVDRILSFDRILKHGKRTDLTEEQKEYYRTKKNQLYKTFLEELTPEDILPGMLTFMQALRANGIKIGIASISQNAPYILEKLELLEMIDGIADPRTVAHSKPAPDIFLKAAEVVGVYPEYCIGVEDAEAGIEAIKSAGMPSVGIGHLPAADLLLESTKEIDLIAIKNYFSLEKEKEWEKSSAR